MPKRPREIAGLVCGYCNGPMVTVVPNREGRAVNPRTMTRDHIFPECRPQDMPDPAQMSRAANRVFCCRECNTRKGSMHPLAWLRIMPGDWRLLAHKLHSLGVSPEAVDDVLDQREDVRQRRIERRAELA